MEILWIALGMFIGIAIERFADYIAFHRYNQ